MQPIGIILQDLRLVLDRTRDGWEEVRGGRIFIAGGTGFFGRWLLESFVVGNRELALDARAVVLTRNLECFKKSSPRLAADRSISLLTGSLADYTIERGGK